MPVLRVCPYCNKKLITSTYGIWEHIKNKCEVYKKIILEENKDINNIDNIDIIDNIDNKKITKKVLT